MEFIKEQTIEIFEKEANYRKNFFINWMKDKTKSLVNKNMYGDFTKTK